MQKKVLAEVEKSRCKGCSIRRSLPNPTNEVVEEAAEIAQKENIDVFVAVGGGSSIDLTKAVNILMTNPGPIGQSWRNRTGKRTSIAINRNPNDCRNIQ